MHPIRTAGKSFIGEQTVSKRIAVSLANKTEEGLIKIKCTGTEELPLDKIKEFQGALKKRTKAQKEKLLESLKTYGFSFPFFIWKNEGINWCLDGHGRLEVLNSLLNKDQLPTFPVVYVQAEDEAEAKKKLLQLNSQYGEIDTEGLQEFIDGIDIDMSEFEIPDIQNKSLVEDDNFDESEVEIKTDIVYGDLFQIGRHRLLCGNAFISDDIVKLMGTQKADIAFTDPPYDLEKEDYAVNLMIFTENAHVFVMHDDKGIINYLRQSKLNFKRFFVADFQFSSPRGNDPYLRHILISHEENGKPIKHQNLYDGFSSILKLEYRFRNKEENYGHKHQKPINFISNFINHYSEESSICLDLFGGSGSTMATCEQLNRQCYMTELNPENCQRIINRMEKIYNLKAIKL